MNIIIVGAGRIGRNLAQLLSEENYQVYLVDNNEERTVLANEKLDVKVILGSGADPDTLNKVNVSQADLVIAVTRSDETNLVVCSLAAFLGSKRQIARVRNSALANTLGDKGYRHFHIDHTINPEHVAAQAIVKTIEAPGAREVGDFADGKILLRAFDIPDSSPLVGAKISDFSDEDFPWPFLIIAIKRGSGVVIPIGDTVVGKQDRVYVLLPAQSLGEFLTFANPDIRKSKKVIIYGASNTGRVVAKLLSSKISDVILIEEDEKKAEDSAEHLEHVKVINGSASEKDILTEAGIEAADVFVAATRNDNSNLISAVLAKKMGAKTTIITTQQPDYVSMIDVMDIDVIINPLVLAAEQILEDIRGKGLHTVTKLLACDAEALELIPEEGSPVTLAPLKDIRFPKNTIVGAIQSGKDVVLASGDIQIKAGERVIVFAQEDAIKKAQALFAKKKLF